MSGTRRHRPEEEPTTTEARARNNNNNASTSTGSSSSSSSSTGSCNHQQHVHDDDDNNSTWIDRALDHLRDHRLHPAVEVAAAWLVALLCLVYYGRVCIISSLSVEQRRVPLVTEVRRRRGGDGGGDDPATEAEKLHQLIEAALLRDGGLAIGGSDRDRGELVARIRSDACLRRQVSRFVMLMPSLPGADDVTRQMEQLYLLFDSIWLDLLRLPSVDDVVTVEHRFEITLILPAYKENGASVAQTLRWALKHCNQPGTVQVIVVDAGHCTGLDCHLQDPRIAGVNTVAQSAHYWGELRLVKYTGSGGRGPCQNFGAGHATGRLLTFLHSDTLVPKNWDAKVKAALRSSTNSDVTTHACSFSVGHNVSKEGLGGMAYPWGIRSILFLGNFRAYLFRLPYGDHILSFPAAYFRYVGGFPDQPIMEDYDIMDLFRQRAKVLPETLRIIPPPTGLCSVRRWQNLGVVYVTLVNALVVNRYVHGGWTADDVFDYYYRRPFQTKKEC